MFYRPLQQRVIAVFLSFLLLIFITLPLHSADAKDYSDNHYFENDALEELIEVRAEDDYDKEEAQEMINRLGKIPERIVRETVNAGATFLIMDTKLTDQPEFEDLKGVVPRGWEGDDSTWSDVPGAGGSVSAARIGYSDYGKDHASINLELHEFSHAIDDYVLGYTISDLGEFSEIHDKEQTDLFPENVPGNDYYDYASEYFAEAMAMYFLDNAQTDKLEERAPETYRFIDQLVERVLSANANSKGNVQLSWEDVAGADVYAIFRNDEIIGMTPDTNYVDNTITESDNYKYSVQAGDEESVLRSTFHRSTNVEVEEKEEKAVKSLDTPENVKTNTDADNVVIVYWDPVSNADYYEVVRNGEVIKETDDERYLDYDLGKADKYEYEIRAVHDDIDSDTSEKVAVDQDIEDTKDGTSSVTAEASTNSFGDIVGKTFKYFFRMKF